MPDVNISYKGESIASMDASGSKTLNTQGKYCEGDITVQYTAPEKPTQSKSVTPTESAQTVTPDSGKVLSQVKVGAIPSTYVGSGVTRKAAATYTPGTTDQTIAAGQYLNGAQTVKGDANLVAGNIKEGVSVFGVQGTHSGGITPSGSVTITENGTYDVANKASAVVNLPYVYKRWVVTIPANHGESGAEIVTFLTDSWLGQHYDDPNIEVRVQIMNAPTLGSTIVFIRSTAGNQEIINGNKQLGFRAKDPTVYIIPHSIELAGTSPSSRGMLKLNSNGDLVVRVDSACILLAGDYEIIARLIP
jgi:hypothetical protein